MREATKNDTPRIGTNETQCMIPGCYKIFSSDTICERAKPYARRPEDEIKRGRIAARDDCIDPLELGLLARDRGDGIIVWGVTSDEEHAEKIERLAKARSKRGTSAKR